MFRSYMYLVVLLALLSVGSVCAQTALLDSVSSQIPVRYAVPDLPAFNALGTEPLQLLRPSTAKDLSMSANQFFDGKNIIIPRSFAVEFSPVSLLKNNQLTLADYQKNAAWYNTRISLGTVRDSLNVSRMALGFRTTLIDKGDPKNDKNLKLTFDRLNAKRDLRTYYVGKQMSLYTESISDSLYEVLSNRFNSEFDQILLRTDSLKALEQDYVRDNLQPIADVYADNKQWNAERLDVAGAMVLASPDSLVGHLQFESLSAWLTYAVPVKDKGQLVVGLNAGCKAVGNNMDWMLSLPARLYYGNNQLKGVLEAQFYFSRLSVNDFMSFRMGCEYRLTDKIWLNFTVGVRNMLLSSASGVVSDFKIMYGI